LFDPDVLADISLQGLDEFFIDLGWVLFVHGRGGAGPLAFSHFKMRGPMATSAAVDKSIAHPSVMSTLLFLQRGHSLFNLYIYEDVQGRSDVVQDH